MGDKYLPSMCVKKEPLASMEVSTVPGTTAATQPCAAGLKLPVLALAPAQARKQKA